MGVNGYPYLQQFRISGKIQGEMKQSKSPQFQKLYLRVLFNDFMVNFVAGMLAVLVLFHLQVIQFENLVQFLIWGSFVLFPFYLFHLIFLYFHMRRSWVPREQFSELDIQTRNLQLKRLVKISFQGTWTTILLWSVAGIYAYYFSVKVSGISPSTGVMTLITFLAMSPVAWLVDSLVVRRILMSTIRRYLSTFPENSLQGLKFYRMSSINKSALAVFYLFILAIYFTLIGSINSYNSMTQKKLREFGKSQLEQIALRIQTEPGKLPVLEHVGKIINETPSIFGSEITVVSSGQGQDKQLDSIAGRNQHQWLIVEKELPGVGKIRFTIEKEKLRAEIISGAIGKNIFLLFMMLLGIGAIVVFQMNQEFKGTLSVINRIADEMSSGNLGNAERLYATDEFWGLYQKLIVVKNNAGKVIGDIREHARLLNQNIRVVEEVSHFLQELSGGQKPLMRNAGDAVSFVDGFADNLQHSISELSLISERTSSTSIEFAASINQVKNSMGKLVGLAENIAGTVRENTSSLKDISSDLRTASGMSRQVEENIREIHDSLGKRIAELGDSKFIVDKQMESTTVFEQNFKEVESHLDKLYGMYVGYQESKTILGKEIGRIEGIARIMDDFIDQAGILALNAAILAARNDSLDSGFGVIADEIKELAERTGGSTGEIRTIVNNTTHRLSSLEEGTKGARVEFRRTKELLEDILSTEIKRASDLKEESSRIQGMLDDAGQDRVQTGTVLDGVRMLKSMVAKTEKSLGKQVAATEKSMETSDEMKEMAGQVMTAAQEQTVGAHQIAGASESIRDLSSDAKSASEKVKEAVQDILHLIQTIEENSEQIRVKSDTLRTVVDDFSGELNALSTEIARFKLPDNK